VALRLMREHDLLVHPSRYETFGVVVVEAAAAGMPVIVTRCGGPEQTLAGVESDAGELIEVEDDSAGIVAAYRRLADRFPDGIDLGAARRTLAGRYGYPAVARQYHEAWFRSDEGV
jgi:glycogen(starch) synthase